MNLEDPMAETHQYLLFVLHLLNKCWYVFYRADTFEDLKLRVIGTSVQRTPEGTNTSSYASVRISQ